MSVTITTGFSWASGNTVTPGRLNTMLSGAVITMATARLLGRTTASTGAVEEITVGTGLSFTGGTLALDLPTALNPVSIGATTPGTGAFTTLSATGVITSTAMAQILSATAASASDKYATIGNTNGTIELGVTASGLGFIGTSTTDDFRLQVGGVVIGLLSSTGLTVTGALSATGNIQVGVNLGFNGGTDEAIAYSAGAIKTYIGGSPITAVSSTGLAVTGTLSSSGAFSATTGAFSGAVSAASLTLSSALAVAQGGTGATSASAARTALGLAIGSDVQAFSSVLSTYAGITPSANVQTLLGSADFAACRSNLGLVIGTNVQAYDADLSALAALSGTNTIYYRSASNTWSAVTIGSNLTFSGGTLSAAGGSGGTIGGSTGGTDNRLIRADGTGGATIQASGITLDDSDNLTGVATIDVGTGGYKVSGTKVLGAQQAAESDIALLTAIGGFDQVDATDIAANFGDLNSKINSLLAKLRAHGLIAT